MHKPSITKHRIVTPQKVVARALTPRQRQRRPAHEKHVVDTPTRCREDFHEEGGAGALGEGKYEEPGEDDEHVRDVDGCVEQTRVVGGEVRVDFEAGELVHLGDGCWVGEVGRREGCGYDVARVQEGEEELELRRGRYVGDEVRLVELSLEFRGDGVDVLVLARDYRAKRA